MKTKPARLNLSRRILAGSIAAALLAAPSAHAATYTWTKLDNGTAAPANWSTGTNWSAVPVSAATTTLIFGYSFGSNSTAETNTLTNDIANPFQLNVLTLGINTPGAGNGSFVALINIAGSPLEFVSNGATTPQVNLSQNRSNGQLVSFDVQTGVILTNNTLFTGNGTGTFLISGAISGAGTFTKGGTSTLSLSSATNSFSGGITVSGGTLAVTSTGTLGSNVNTNNIGISAGAILTLAAAGNTGANQTITLTSTAGSLAVLGLGNNSVPAATIAQADTNGGVIALNAFSGYNQNLSTLLTGKDLFLGSIGTSTFTGAAGTVAAGNGTTYRLGGGGGQITFSTANLFTSSNNVLVGSTATNGGGTVVISAAQNYSGTTTVAAGTLRVGNATALGTSAVSVTSGAVLDLNGTTMSGNNTLTLNGTGISGGGALTNGSATAGTYDGLVSLGSASSISATTGAITLSNVGTITGSGFGLTVTGGFNTTIASIIGTGAGSLTKTGAGTLFLSNASNSYTGPTTITAGTLSVGVAGNLGDAASNLVFNGGTLQITGTGLTSLSGLGRTNPVVFNSGLTVGLDIANAANVFTVDQTLNQGTGGLTKSGAGTLVINSAHTYTGATTISAGTLRLDSGGSIATSSGVINNSVYMMNQNATAGTAPLTNIAGSGSIAAGPSAILTINTATGLSFNALNTTGGGSFALSGVTTPTLGGLVGTTGSLSASFSSGYSGVTNLTLNTAANNIAGNSFTYAGVIDDGAAGMSLTKTGAGTQTLTGDNTYTGTTFLNGGTLAIGSGSTVGKISGTTAIVFNGGTLQFNRSGTTDLAAIPNGAPITVNSSSTFGVTSADAGNANANETVGAVTLNAGQMNFNWTNGGSSGTQMILTSLSRSGTASANFNSGFASNNSRWKVTGAGTTTGGQIIGPWYTTGGNNAGFASTDYAVYSSDFVAQAAIAGSAETTWTNTANAYTMSANQTLTAPRTITALRNTFATAPTLTLASGFNLETYGLLNGANAVFTVAPGTGGVLTTPTGGGNLYITAGANAITVSAPINNNGGNVTLVKNGSGTLTLTSITSNFSGGVVLNAGTLSIDSALSLGGANNTGGSTVPITVNGSSTISMPTNNLTANFGTGAITIANGATLTVTGSSRPALTFGGAVTGDGGVTATGATFWAQYRFNSTANDFKGAITDSRSSNDGIANALLSFNSIADGAGYGNIILNGSTDDGIDYGSGAIATLNLSNRQLVLANNNTVFFNNASSQAVNINSDIGFSGTGARQIRFGISGRSGAGVSTFAGKLADNVGGALSPTFNGGTWVVSGNNNTYTGTTNVSGTSVTTFSGNNTLTGQITVSGTGSLTLSGDNSGMSSNVTMSTALNNATSPLLNINSATALGTGILNFGGGAATDTVRLDNTSAGLVTVSTNNVFTLNRNFTFIGTRSLTLGAGVTTTIGGITAPGARTISVTANTLTFAGSIGETVALLGVNKSGAGTLVLSGTGSTFSGATTVTAGTLAGIGANAFGNTNGISIAAAGTLSLRGDSNTNFVTTTGSTPYAVKTSASLATINVDQATVAGTTLKTMGIGTLGTTSTANIYQVNFTGASNTSLSVGAATGPANNSATTPATVTFLNSIASTGTLTLASYTSANVGTAAGAAETVIFDGGLGTSTIVTGAITPSANPLSLRKNGLGTLTLNGAETYTGATDVNNGTLNLNGTLGTGSNVLNANATTNIGVSQTLAALNIGAGAVVTLTATPPFAPLAGEALSGPTSAVVPEPGSIGLLLVGSLGLLARRRRQA